MFGVEPICAVLSEHGGKIAPSAPTTTPAPARPSKRALRDAEIVDADRRGPGAAGSVPVRCPQDVAAPARKGHDVARCTVERLMAAQGWTGALRGQGSPHHDPPPSRPAAGGSGRPGLHRGRAEPAVGRRLRAPRGVREPCGGERTTARRLSQQACGSWRTPVPGVGVGWSSPRQRRVVPVLPDGAGSASETERHTEEPAAESPSRRTTDPKPGGHGSGCTAHPPASVGGGTSRTG